MSVKSRGCQLAGLVASALLAAPAAAEPPKPAAPAPPPTAAPKPAAPAAKKAAPRAPAKPPEPALPDPEVKLRIIAPSPWGLWTMRIENDGAHPVRVPADVRLLRLSIESGNTMTKKAAKPIQCQAPAGLRPDGFPDTRALLLAPGEAYVETFDPRLFCFGKDLSAITGGVIVRARLGWDAPKNAKKLEAPFAAESTEFPPAVAPQKLLVAPTIVLSYEPPDDEPPKDDADAEGEKADDDKPKGDKVDGEKAKDEKAKDEKAKDEKTGKEEPPKPPIVDEMAPRIELKASPYADAANGHRVTLTVTATNAGHRPALAAIRTRMLTFRVDGPDGVVRCGLSQRTRAIPRDGYRPLKPGGSTSLTILLEEACGRPLFRRPGLYKVTPSLHLVESGSELGLAAYTGVARVKDPTFVRIASGPDPFHAGPPKAVRIVKPEIAEAATP